MTQEIQTTTLLEDLKNVVAQLQSGKIDIKQTIEVLDNISSYEKELIYQMEKLNILKAEKSIRIKIKTGLVSDRLGRKVIERS